MILTEESYKLAYSQLEEMFASKDIKSIDKLTNLIVYRQLLDGYDCKYSDAYLAIQEVLQSDPVFVFSLSKVVHDAVSLLRTAAV